MIQRMHNIYYGGKSLMQEAQRSIKIENNKNNRQVVTKSQNRAVVIVPSCGVKVEESELLKIESQPLNVETIKKTIEKW